MAQKSNNSTYSVEFPSFSENVPPNQYNRAKQLLHYGEAVFSLHNEVHKLNWDKGQHSFSDYYLEMLFFTSCIGLAFLSECSDAIDRMEMEVKSK